MASRTAVAEPASSTGKAESLRTWEDLGFDSAPEGFPTDEIALMDGLNTSRGAWSFSGSVYAMILGDSVSNIGSLGFGVTPEGKDVFVYTSFGVQVEF